MATELRVGPVMNRDTLQNWLDDELAGCQLDDLRHGKRFRALLGQLGDSPGASMPFACQD